jgi:ribosomal protein S18 acetylase RimI-like enzyme
LQILYLFWNGQVRIMRIRKAKISDATACLRIARQEKEKYWKLVDFERCVKDRHAVLIVAEDGKKITGYCLGFIVPTKRSEALLHETRVDLNYRNQKIGTRLVDAVCKGLYSKGAKTVDALIEEKHKKFYCGAAGFSKTKTWLAVQKKKSGNQLIKQRRIVEHGL